MRTKFIIIVLIQVLLLAGIVGYRHAWVATGSKIILKTVPVDPRDIFRGQYVHLNYEISNLDLDALGMHEKFFPGEKVYVALAKNSDTATWSPVAVGKASPSGTTFIQGIAGYESVVSRWHITLQDDAGAVRTFDQQWNSGITKDDRAVFCMDKQDRVLYFFKDTPEQKRTCGTNTAFRGIVTDLQESRTRRLNASFGIEDYFVEEGRGPEIERARAAKSVTVEVSLRSDGRGIISRLLIDGTPYGKD